MSKHYDALVGRFKKLGHLQHAQTFLSWDQQVMMPNGGNAARSEALSELAGMGHELLTSPELSDWFASAEEEALTADQQVSLFEMRRQWQQAETASYRKNKQQPITGQWQPSQDAMDILCKQGAININFIEDAIPEFILYWRGTGEASSTWDSKFVQHVRRQWQFFNGMMNQDKSPQIITGSWQPNESVYDVLRMANIERDFAERLIPEFVLYWQENGSAQCSWSTKFLQYVKRQWARHSQPQTTGNNYGKQQGSDSAGRIRDRSIIDALSDRSWAS